MFTFSHLFLVVFADIFQAVAMFIRKCITQGLPPNEAGLTINYVMKSEYRPLFHIFAHFLRLICSFSKVQALL